MKILSMVPIETLWQRSTAHLKSARVKQILGGSALALGVALGAFSLTSTLTPPITQASDHDDGDIDVRSRALSLTDLYAFREKDQSVAANANDLVFIMNTNPRSVARQQYFFSTQARYEFRFSRVANKDAAPTGRPDVILRFEFSKPDQANRQKMTITLLDQEDDNPRRVITRTVDGQPIVTTALAANPATPPTLNQINVDGTTITVFAGLREDPFYFDVEQYFRVRAGAAGLGPAVGFRSPSQALDFAKGYNVNAIAVRIPRKLLQGGSEIKTFDAWLSLSIPDPRTGKFRQTEQLARPGINELLTSSTQAIYELYNRTQPGINRNEIRTDIKNVLQAIGNAPERADALVNALLPDVMRIDTTQRSGYVNNTNALGAPITGRLLLDDVVDQSLTILTEGRIPTDNVSYSGTPGNAAQGHKDLVQSFPYLALPN